MLLLQTQIVVLERLFVASAQPNRPIWNKMSLYSPENYDFHEVFLSKTNSILTGKQCF
jgi:hypothetical protein